MQYNEKDLRTLYHFFYNQIAIIENLYFRCNNTILFDRDFLKISLCDATDPEKNLNLEIKMLNKQLKKIAKQVIKTKQTIQEKNQELE